MTSPALFDSSMLGENFRVCHRKFWQSLAHLIKNRILIYRGTSGSVSLRQVGMRLQYITEELVNQGSLIAGEALPPVKPCHR